LLKAADELHTKIKRGIKQEEHRLLSQKQSMVTLADSNMTPGNIGSGLILKADAS